MWEDCLWNYVFPTLDRVSHMAATSSRDEWQGKELGIRGGKAVHMLIHHSRNTAQKQWDETLVLVFSGIARLLRSFFSFLRNINNFWSGWESLLLIVKDSIFNGSKEVSLAAINCLQTTVLGHCSKGNLPMPYLVSVLDVYEVFIQESSNYSTTVKVKQEVLLGLGELYVQAQRMFDNQMYTRLLAIIGLAIKQNVTKSDNCEDEFLNLPLALRTLISYGLAQGHVHHLLRTALEVLPMLRPAKNLSSMWLILLRELLQYLPGLDSPPHGEEEEAVEVSTSDLTIEANGKMKSGTTYDTASASVQKAEVLSLTSSSAQEATLNIPSYLFAEKIIPVLVDLVLQAPAIEKYIIFPEVIHSLGRSMITRRDNPEGSLWRLAVKGFNRILVEDISKVPVDSEPDSKISKPARLRIWKEIADVYEIFLVGYCGRALPPNSLSPATLKDDESLEMTIVDILAEQILKSSIDAPSEILQRLVSTLDRCASRTCSLPVETVGLMPLHCSSFSDEEGSWNSTRSEISKYVIMVLMMRCECILNRFLADEKEIGDRPLPTTRLEEVIFVLQELACIVIHFDTASVLPLQPHLRTILAEGNSNKKQPHLLGSESERAGKRFAQTHCKAIDIRKATAAGGLVESGSSLLSALITASASRLDAPLSEPNIVDAFCNFIENIMPLGIMVLRPVALTSTACIAAASLHSTGFSPDVRAVASSASPMVISPPRESKVPTSW
ncbi:protein MON2-like protein isoform X2 [Hibiscus syriacus]|uniref:Protein MON2-like protein isoform X2 n=1 Tax=Hibiscus syriacus TaxID=106335 RepID=A0A6A2YXM7_HIBSY|nr:protein MON2-like protein isoform X2 [Hibiscus syriacus]